MIDIIGGEPIIAEAASYFDWDDDEPNLLWYAGDTVEGIVFDALEQPHTLAS